MQWKTYQIINLKTSELTPSTPIVDQTFQDRLCASIKEHGMKMPILVVRTTAKKFRQELSKHKPEHIIYPDQTIHDDQILNVIWGGNNRL